MSKYVIACPDDETSGFYINFFCAKYGRGVLVTRISPTVFPNKKKAKRVMKRLNKQYGDFFLMKYEN